MTHGVLTVGVIGMGNVGPAIASTLRAAGADIAGVSARSPEARDRAEAMLPGVPLLEPQEVAEASDVLFLAVPDDQIEDLAAQLADSGVIRPGTVVAHLSGAQGVSPLQPVAQKGALPIALHPAMTFSGTSLDILRLRDCPVAYTCSVVAQPVALALIQQLGGQPVPVEEEDRPLYHAALAHVANHLVTVVAEGDLALAAAGIDEPRELMRPLVEAATARALEEGIAGLTGPASRGDEGTLAAHMAALDAIPELRNVAGSYRVLARSTKAALRGPQAEPLVVRTRRELKEALAADPRSTALVMTMGALHQGHLDLVKAAARPGTKVVVTIFVNPEQFGPGEDFETYPRDLDADVAALSDVGADIVYAPPVDQVYPRQPRVRIQPGPAGRILEGYLRPGHFAGVLQVVGKVFDLVRSDTAVFGQKDAQQFVNIRQMTQDLDQQVRLVEAPIVRSGEGLALSSRNAYLSDAQRNDALALFQSLKSGEEKASQGASPVVIVEEVASYLRRAPGVEPQYVALADAESFDVYALWTPDGSRLGVENDTPLHGCASAYLLVAAQVGPARLIDNVLVKVTGDE